MKHEIVKITTDLLKFRTTQDNPQERDACAEYIEQFFTRAGLPLRPYESNGVKSLLIGPTDRQVRVCLNGHYDVVPAEPEQFDPRALGDMLYGRGAADMKASLAALMLLMRELYKMPEPPPVALMIVGDEEVGGLNGTRHILEQGFSCEFALAGEPSNLRIANQAKGALKLELTARGRAGHAARPWEGDNAILNMLAVFPNIWEVFGDPDPQQWKTTLVPTVIQAGSALNRVPEKCSMSVDIRHLPSEFPEEIIIKIKKAAPEIEVRELERLEACYCDPFGSFVEKLKAAAKQVLGSEPEIMKKHAASDAMHFFVHQIPAVVFGPGGLGVHGPDECVDLNEVMQFYKIIEAFAKDVAW